jgi:hypothetical protein
MAKFLDDELSENKIKGNIVVYELNQFFSDIKKYIKNIEFQQKENILTKENFINQLVIKLNSLGQILLKMKLDTINKHSNNYFLSDEEYSTLKTKAIAKTLSSKKEIFNILKNILDTYRISLKYNDSTAETVTDLVYLYLFQPKY